MLTVQQRDLIAAAFGSAVDEVVVEHHPALTQEHQLVSRIAQRLEDRLNGLALVGVLIQVDTQELPDKGSGALERKIGADLFVSITVENEFSKGFLVQAKWRESLDSDRYAQQCQQMTSVSKASYGWEFGRSGTRVFTARSVVNRVSRSGFEGRRSPFEFGWKIPTVIGRLLVCKAGDVRLGIPNVRDRRAYIRSMLTEWGASRSVELIVTKK